MAYSASFQLRTVSCSTAVQGLDCKAMQAYEIHDCEYRETRTKMARSAEMYNETMVLREPTISEAPKAVRRVSAKTSSQRE